MRAISGVEVSAYTVPTATRPESDGTAVWNATTLVLVELAAGGKRGLGYTYADLATARILRDVLAPDVRGRDAFDTVALWTAAVRAVRNHGRGGVCAMAISALDNAAWDLKAKLLSLPLASLLGQARSSVPAYGSGGFTSYSMPELQQQLGGWAEQGFSMMKMKVGREPSADVARVSAARKAIGPDAALFVDANGAYSRKQALDLSLPFAELGVSWYEEPVVKTDLAGLRLLRDRALMEVAGGEYGYELADFRAFVEADCLDVIQADVTRCGGVTGFLQPRRSALRSTCRCPRTARRRCMCRSVATFRNCGTSNGSSITSASRGCSSTACRSRRGESCGPTSRGQASASRSNTRTRTSSAPRYRRCFIAVPTRRPLRRSA